MSVCSKISSLSSFRRRFMLGSGEMLRNWSLPIFMTVSSVKHCLGNVPPFHRLDVIQAATSCHLLSSATWWMGLYIAVGSYIYVGAHYRVWSSRPLSPRRDFGGAGVPWMDQPPILAFVFESVVRKYYQIKTCLDDSYIRTTRWRQLRS